ncbi:LVIVD repeat-containing protein [Myxococcus sp. RHSTA-1-4]|uniref:LVIVD repeat-containing protein n=1 Tax=Myxococcus sp. RHSTA-1-4 TaxID=2874601 RepID=UPI001CBEAE4B|nr:hypothetical protein [Myxococcus sp. RHSTA-1-4]
MRRLLALSSTLFLTLGCGKDDTSGPKAECQLEAIDLSACQRSTLAAVQPEGVWHLNVLLNDNSGSASSMKLSSSEASGATLLGFSVTERQVSADTFFMASDLTDADGYPLRFVVAGCSAKSPTEMAGVFRRCRDGAMDLRGTFEAVRVTRRAGEEESSKVELAGEVALPRGSATELAVAGGRAYVTAGSEGLFIFDVSNPTQPKRAGEGVKPSNDFFSDVLVHGQTLYVATRNSGIAVFDLTDPLVPARVRSIPEQAVEVTGLAIDGNLLLAASPSPNAEVLIYDITQPTAPKLVTRYTIKSSAPALGERPLDVTALNGRMYISHWTFGLAVVDLAKPSAPEFLGRFGSATSRSTAVGVVGNRTLAFDAGEDWGAHLSVLNVTAPNVGVDQVGEFRMRPEVSIRSVALSGTKLYVAYYQDGLRVLDVSVPGAPQQVGYFNTWRELDPGRGLTFFDGLNNVRVPGDGYIYATDTYRGLMVFRETE